MKLWRVAVGTHDAGTLYLAQNATLAIALWQEDNASTYRPNVYDLDTTGMTAGRVTGRMVIGTGRLRG